MIIRRADNNDIPSLRILWKNCFADPDEYLDLFFQKRFAPNFCAVMEIDGEVVGMAHFLPCDLNGNKALYWYAVGILSKYRNQGLFRALILKAYKESKRSGYFNLCVPAQGLESVYEKYGFTRRHFRKEWVYRRSDEFDRRRGGRNVKIRRADPTDYRDAMRDRRCVTWDLEPVRYAFSENNFCGGTQLRIETESKPEFAFIVRNGEQYCLDHATFSPEQRNDWMDEILNHLKCDSILVRSVANASANSDAEISFLSDCDDLPADWMMTLHLS